MSGERKSWTEGKKDDDKVGMDDKTKAELMQRLEKHPELWTQVAALLGEVENSAGALGTADEAEEALIERMRRLGQAGLSAWAQQRCAQVNAAGPAQARRGGKKNSGG